MKKIYRYMALMLMMVLLSGCSDFFGMDTFDEEQNNNVTEKRVSTYRAYYVDAPIVNLPYQCGENESNTDNEGGFRFVPGDICRFHIGSLTFRMIHTDTLKDGDYVFESDVSVAALLQSLDKNHLYGTHIEIADDLIEVMEKMDLTTLPRTEDKRRDLIDALNRQIKTNPLALQDDQAATAHMKQSIAAYRLETLHMTNPSASWIDQDCVLWENNQSNPDTQLVVEENQTDRHEQEESVPEVTLDTPATEENQYLTDHNWVQEERVYTSEVQTHAQKRDYTLLAWSELGMHCMDGADYSVFSLLPPYSTLKAQVIVTGASPRIASREISLTYESMAKEDGTINTTSKGKTNFWQYADKLFPGAMTQPTEDIGLTGTPVQHERASAMEFNASQHLFVAEGIPTVPFNDDMSRGEYPLVKVVARDKEGNLLAQTTTTLPVSDEMDCLRCHTSRMDVLEKHDKNYPNAVRDYESNLTARGFDYNASGLAATASSGTPVLCASCHKSNALPDSGIEGIKPLTEAIHGAHAYRNDPTTDTLLTDSQERISCYACHPGESTKCLRGAMGNSGQIECQSCHGTMETVAQQGRKGWEDEPNCQSCHQEGKRYTNAVTDLFQGTLRSALDKRFATEQTLLDPHGPRLYKFSSGHGGVACAGCHGAQHAIYPSARPEENQQSIDLQGYAGTLRECSACHSEGTVLSAAHGPHGMHTTDQRWVDMHGTVVLRSGTQTCKSCHGEDLEGTGLSTIGTSKSFKLGVLDKTITFEGKEKVSCQKCHNSMEEN